MQAQIESLNGTHAHLMRRIDTDLLTIELSSPVSNLVFETTPVRDALRESSRNFREALAAVIVFVAMLVPWLFVILPSLILLRLFWRWVGRWLGRFERRPA
jgi:hypothetical protein